MLIATFGPTTAWLGKTINFENGQFVLEGHGPISASGVLEYDRQGHLIWANAAQKAFVIMQLGQPVPQVKRKSRWTNKQVIYLVVLLGVLSTALMLIVTGVQGYMEDRQFKPLEPHLAEYLDQRQRAPEVREPYIVGKVVTVDLDEQHFSHLMFDLPEELRAGDPDEVGTVVQLSYSAVVVGTYTDGSQGCQYRVRVNVIDLAKGYLLESKDFVGSSPPQSKVSTEDGDQYGEKPDPEIVSWLQSLSTEAGTQK